MTNDPVRRHWTQASRHLLGQLDDPDPWEDLTAEPEGVRHREVDAGGTPALWVEPEQADPQAVLCYLHGGGFVSGSVWTHRKLVGHLAAAIGVRALLVSYGHVPDHVHPAQLDQVTCAYRWLLDRGVAPERVAVAGDSVGGWLALSLVRRLREDRPAALMVVSTVLDLTQSGASYATNAERDPIFHKPFVDQLVAAYLGGASASDPAIDLLQADLTGFPPMAIQVGADETLLDESRTLHAMAGKAGVESRLEVFPGQLHTFQMAAGRTRVADEAIRSLADWARPRLGITG